MTQTVTQNLRLRSSGPCKLLIDMVGTTGFEPATSSVSRKRSNQLSYAPAMQLQLVYQEPGGGKSQAGSALHPVTSFFVVLKPLCQMLRMNDCTDSAPLPTCSRCRVSVWRRFWWLPSWTTTMRLVLASSWSLGSPTCWTDGWRAS